TTPNFLRVRGFRMAMGEMFTQADIQARRRVAILGADVLPMLEVGNAPSMMGEKIRVAGRQFTVIGVMEKRGVAGASDGDNQILVPFSVGRFSLFGTDRIQDIWTLVSTEHSLNV